jgi:glycosyltransferase involved in cell wall biosynthesis
MRIAFISPNASLGGGEMMMLTLATWCRDQGHDVLVVAPSDGEQWLNEEAERRGIDTYKFRRTGPLDVRFLRELTHVLRMRKIELVHAHMFAGAYFGVAAARWLRIRSVVTFHCGSEQTALFRRRVIMRWILRNADEVTVVSEQMRDDLSRELGSGYERMQVVVNGMPTPVGDRGVVRRELGLADDERLIVALGSCCHRKNHVALVHALARMAPTTQPWRLAICGREDDATSDIRAAVDTHGLHERVDVLGRRLDTGNIFAATDIFAMPSLWEGTPLALIEAMLASKPSVASDIGGIPEMIDDGVHGLLVAPTDVDALARALRRLVTNEDGVASRCAVAAEHRASTVYGLTEMCNRYHQIFERALAARRDRSQAAARVAAL